MEKARNHFQLKEQDNSPEGANNEIDLRTEEEIKLERQKMLASLKWN